MNIRAANENDSKNLIELMQKADKRTHEWAVERAYKYTHEDSRLIFVAEEDSKLLGLSGLIRLDLDINAGRYLDVDSFSHLTWIAVVPDSRLHGIGSGLIQKCYSQALVWDKHGIWLNCRERVKPFYLKNGFQIAGNYMHEGDLRYVMKKFIIFSSPQSHPQK